MSDKYTVTACRYGCRERLIVAEDIPESLLPLFVKEAIILRELYDSKCGGNYRELSFTSGRIGYSVGKNQDRFGGYVGGGEFWQGATTYTP